MDIRQPGRTTRSTSSYGDITVQCRWVFDCSGRRSSFARALGAVRRIADKQIAVSVVGARRHIDADLTTTIETCLEGWWYTAPFPGDRRIFTLFTNGETLAHCGARSLEGFRELAERTRHISSLLAAGSLRNNPPEVVLANSSVLLTAAGEQWFAAGDAAASLDPLASAGIIDAVKSAKSAVEASLQVESRPEDYSRAVFERYSEQLRTQSSYYRMENRWPTSGFWGRWRR